MISTVTHIIIDCDKCHDSYQQSAFETQRDAIHYARQDGWFIAGRKNVLCPDCLKAVNEII